MRWWRASSAGCAADPGSAARVTRRSRALHDEVRMVAPESFGDHAAPAHGTGPGQQRGQILGRDLAPLPDAVVRRLEGRLVIVPVDGRDRPPAQGARLAVVPPAEQVAHEASMRRLLD